MSQSPQKLPRKFPIADILVKAFLIVFIPFGIWIIEDSISSFIRTRDYNKHGYVRNCARILSAVATAQELFITDHNRYAHSIRELNFYKGRVYIEEKKVAKLCKNPKSQLKGKGYIITGHPTAVFENCKITYTDTNNSTKGVCK